MQAQLNRMECYLAAVEYECSLLGDDLLRSEVVTNDLWKEREYTQARSSFVESATEQVKMENSGIKKKVGVLSQDITGLRE